MLQRVQSKGFEQMVRSTGANLRSRYHALTAGWAGREQLTFLYTDGADGMSDLGEIKAYIEGERICAIGQDVRTGGLAV